MMAEFQEVMRQWKRMCDWMGKVCGDDACDKCPVYTDDDCSCGAMFEIPSDTDWEHAEQNIMSWAAEHPEPVYPTWGEYLVHIGCLASVWEDTTEMYDRALYVGRTMHTPIPADIAEKLGIEPKEE